MKSCDIYFRDDAIYLFCLSETVFGVWIWCEPIPVYKLSRNITAMALGEAVLNTLQFSQTKIPHPDNLQLLPERFFKSTGFKNWRAFYKNSFNVSVTFDGADMEVTPCAPGGRGSFVPLLDKAVKYIPQAEEVGKLILNFCA